LKYQEEFGNLNFRSKKKTNKENLHKNTGKPLEEWIEVVKKERLLKHGEIMKFLKEQHLR
jgi:hypothetical protein